MSPPHVIDRVAVRGIGDPAASRAWTRRALEPVDLDGIVPPAATLVLRSAWVSGGHPGAALRRAACDAARTAARPATGPVGASAEAVLFADDAELLTCITRDLLDGTFAAAWWWAAYRRSGSGGPLAVMARTWVERAAAAPAALHALARTGHAAAALRQLPEPAVRELAAAAVTAGVLAPAVAAQVLTAPAPRAPRSAAASERGERHDRTPVLEPGEQRDPPAARESRPELVAAVAEVAAADGPATVLGAALLLAHRSPDVLAAVPEGAFAHVIAAARRPHRPAPEPAAAPGAPIQVTADEDPVLVAGPAGAERARRTGTRPRPVPPGPAAGAAGAPSSPAHLARAEHSSAPDAAPLPRAVAGIRTPLAGAFLLLTVACDLGLYPDFTRPRDRGLPMSPWTWLAHTTAQLVGVRDPEDPLWTLLAGLAGEPEAAPPGRAPELRTTTRRVARRLDSALGRRKSARRVVVRPGTVHAGPARVDVTFALDDVDVAIRACGLDSDPGWLPAAARDVRLHYR